MFLVEDLAARHGNKLGLKLLAGKTGLKRRIKVPEAQRPGLSLSGYLKNHASKRILIFGRVEIQYLHDLAPEVRLERLKAIISSEIPAVMISKGHRASRELIKVCEEAGVALFSCSMTTMNLISKLMVILLDAFALSINVHGTLVEVYGVGVLIQGDSSVGKSEAALGLIERGHRLVSDDIVVVKRREDDHLEGYQTELTRHLMEIRGIGIINVADLYGVVCVRDHKSIDLIVQLETWDDTHFYDRVGVDQKNIKLLDVDVPCHTLPVKPGRDVVLLLETIALNHRLKKMGYHPAEEFSTRLTEAITVKKRRKR